MMRIGLTGGIAAGKSVAARRFAERGAALVDHDVLAREAVAPGSTGLGRVVEEFGTEVFAADGSLDRRALGRIVFADDDARARLNAIVHPEVHRLSDEADREAAERGAEVVVHDIPLLVETGQAGDFDLLVVVHAPVEERLRRLTELRGMDPDEARGRIAAQASDEERLGPADVVLDAAGSEDHLRTQVDELWRRIGAGRPQTSGA